MVEYLIYGSKMRQIEGGMILWEKFIPHLRYERVCLRKDDGECPAFPTTLSVSEIGYLQVYREDDSKVRY